MDFMSVLLDPRVLGVFGPVGVVLIAVAVTFYRLYIHERDKNEELTEKRVQESQAMQKEYYELAADVDKTLDLLTNMIGKKNGGA